MKMQKFTKRFIPLAFLSNDSLCVEISLRHLHFGEVILENRCARNLEDLRDIICVRGTRQMRKDLSPSIFVQLLKSFANKLLSIFECVFTNIIIETNRQVNGFNLLCKQIFLIQK